MTGPGPWELQEALAVTAVSRTWRVLLGGSPAVLRVDEPGARRLGLNRRDEAAVLQAAAAAGLGPAPISADPARGVLLTAWLPGRAWSTTDLQQPENLRRAAGLLRQVHAVRFPAPVVDLGAAVDRYAAGLGEAGAQARREARELLARALGPWTGLAETPACLCHNDPTPGNFIASPAGRLWLIDWEYAGLCHPGFDLAGLAVGADLPVADVEILVRAYLGRSPTRVEMARQEAWEAFCRSLGALWDQALNPGNQGLAGGA